MHVLYLFPREVSLRDPLWVWARMYIWPIKPQSCFMNEVEALYLLARPSKPLWPLRTTTIYSRVTRFSFNTFYTIDSFVILNPKVYFKNGQHDKKKFKDASLGRPYYLHLHSLVCQKYAYIVLGIRQICL